MRTVLFLLTLACASCAPTAPEPTIGRVVYDPPPEPAQPDSDRDAGIKPAH